MHSAVHRSEPQADELPAAQERAPVPLASEVPRDGVFDVLHVARGGDVALQDDLLGGGWLLGFSLCFHFGFCKGFHFCRLIYASLCCI